MTEMDRILAVQYNGQHLKTYNERNRTYQVCLAAVGNDGTAIHFVPQCHRTYEMYLTACKSRGSVLKGVPDEMKDAAMCLAAVQSDGVALQNVPDELKTVELCRAAVCKSSSAFAYMPMEFITPEFCISAISQQGDYSLIQSLPAEMKKTAFYERMITADPNVFFYIPKKNRTAKICRIAIKGLGYPSIPDAVRKNRELFDYLNVSLLDHDTCLAFVEGSAEITDRHLMPRTEQPLEKILISEDICAPVLAYLGRLLQYVPEKVITENLCRIAVENDYCALSYVPEHMVTKELCEIAFSQSVTAIKYIPPEYLDDEKCLAAVEHNGSYLGEVPEHLRTREVCSAALETNMYAIVYVPAEYITKEIILSATEGTDIGVEVLVDYIPEHVWDNEVFEAITKKWGIFGSPIQYVPETVLSYEMCLTGVRNVPYSVFDVPAQYQTLEIYCTVAQGLGKYGYPYDWRIIERIPDKWKTDDFYEIARKNVSDKCRSHFPRSDSEGPRFIIKESTLVSVDLRGCLHLTIPQEAKHISDYVISDEDLKTVTVCDGVESFDEIAFYHCKRLETIAISSTVKALPLRSFEMYLPRLREINVSKDNPYYSSIEGILYNKDHTEIIRCPQHYPAKRVVVPDSVLRIDENAFYGCDIDEIVLPNHSLEIGAFAFAYCKNLKTVNLPEGIKSISYGLFSDSGIESIGLPKSVEGIESSAFRSSNLQHIKLPDGIRYIDRFAFQPVPMKKIRIPKSVTEQLMENTFFDPEIEYETDLTPDGYLLFGTDGNAVARFSEAKCQHAKPLKDEDYIRLIEKKSLLKKHFVLIAFLRVFIDCDELSEEIKDTYLGIIKSQKKRLLTYLVQNHLDEYVRILLESRMITPKDVKTVDDDAGQKC